MPAFNFKRQFVPHILSGRKHHTIRAERKDGQRPDPGDPLYLFTGMRTKQCERIGESPCTRVEDIRITLSDDQHLIQIADEQLAVDECDSLAYHDGFDSFTHMMSFWEGRLPFAGFITYWKPLGGKQ